MLYVGIFMDFLCRRIYVIGVGHHWFCAVWHCGECTELAYSVFFNLQSGLPETISVSEIVSDIEVLGCL